MNKQFIQASCVFRGHLIKGNLNNFFERFKDTPNLVPPLYLYKDRPAPVWITAICNTSY